MSCYAKHKKNKLCITDIRYTIFILSLKFSRTVNARIKYLTTIIIAQAVKVNKIDKTIVKIGQIEKTIKHLIFDNHLDCDILKDSLNLKVNIKC